MGAACNLQGICNHQEVSAQLDQERLFEKIYPKLILNDVLNNPAVPRQKRKQIVLEIYYNIGAQLWKNIAVELNRLQLNYTQSPHKTTCIQQIAQFMKSIQFFWTEVLHTKKIIQEKTTRFREELRDIKDFLKKGLPRQKSNGSHDNKGNQSLIVPQPLKRNEAIHATILQGHLRPQAGQVFNHQGQQKAYAKQNDSNSAEIKAQAVQIKQKKQEPNEQYERESKITNFDVRSKLTYSYQMDLLQIKQRQKEASQLEVDLLKNNQHFAALKEKKQSMEKTILFQHSLIEQEKAQIEKLLRENTQLNQAITYNKDKIETLENDKQQLRESNKRLLATIASLTDQKTKLEQELTSYVMKQRDSADFEVYQGDLPRIQKQNDYFTILKYFRNSKLLPNFQECSNAARLRMQILKLFEKQVKSTKLIYVFDPLSQLHFEKYIQNKQNLFVLLLLQKQIYIGGFAGQIDTNQELQDSFLFSISLQRDAIKLYCKDKVKRIDFEPGFLNFGNSEIKIKCRSLDFTCNVGGVFTKYSAKNSISIERFLGSQQRSCRAKGLEIYEMQFDDY